MESPANSNRTKYGQEFGLNGYAWCVMFLWWVFKEAGESNAFFAGAKTASCGTLLRWYREQGYSGTAPMKGDIVILNFHHTQDTEHCGLVVDVHDDGTFTTIEGNTSSAGSQDNGGCVMKKTRYLSQVVGICRPVYQPEPAKVQTDYEGHWAEKAIQTVMDKGLMIGDGKGNFRPNDPLTRAEMATILTRL